MPTVEDLGKAVKAKYPGAYDDLDNVALGQMVQKKYPGSYEDYTPIQAQKPSSDAWAAPQIPGSGKLHDIAQSAVDFANSGANEGIRHLANLGGMILPAKYGGDASKKIAAEIPQASGLGGTLGANTEKALEFAAPIGTAGSIGAKVAPVAGRLAGEAIASGAISKAQGDSNLGAAVNAAIPVVGAPLMKYAGKLASHYLGISTGAGQHAIEAAFTDPKSSGLARAYSGNLDEGQVVDNFVNSVTGVRDRAAAEYAQRLDAIKNSSLPKNWQYNSSKLVDDLRVRLAKELPSFGVKKDPVTGELNFRYSTLPDDAKAKLGELVNTLHEWGGEPEDLTPSGLDILKKKIGAYTSGSGVEPIANRLYDQARNGLNGIIPGYQEMTSKWAESQDLLRRISKEFGVKAGTGAPSPGTVTRKLSNLFKQNNNYRELLLRELGPEGQDLLNQVAGLHLSHFAPRGLAQFLDAGLVGILGKGLHQLPAAAVIAASGSPKLVGGVARGAGIVAQSPEARKAIQAGTQAAVSGLTSPLPSSMSNTYPESN